MLRKISQTLFQSNSYDSPAAQGELSHMDAVTELRAAGASITRGILFDIVERVSVRQLNGKPNATLLFSGPATFSLKDAIPRNTSGEIALQGKGEPATIQNTHAARLMISNEFNNALVHIFGDSPIPSDDQIQFLYRSRAESSSSPGVWDMLSHRFASAIEGQVVTFTPFAEQNRIFTATEVPALLANKKVTKINGTDIVVYRRIQRHFLKEGMSSHGAAIEAAKSINYLSYKTWNKAEPPLPKGQRSRR